MLPPCHQPGRKPNQCAAERYSWLILGNGDLWGHWTGWRVAGSHLISPDGVRLSIHLLEVVAFVERQRARYGTRAVYRMAAEEPAA